MKIAFVAPFFGRRASGGAEAECRRTAIHLAAAGIEVDILTTTLLDLVHDWNVAFHPAGVTGEDGLTVRRFPAEPVSKPALARLNRRLLAGEILSDREAEQFFALHVASEGLFRWLGAHAEAYDRVCFIPYLFGTSVYGAQLCPGRRVLVPCLHDEAYARTAPVADLFRSAERIVFHARAERDLAARLYGEEVAARGILAGEGVDLDFEADGDRFRRAYGLDGPLILYAGRKDATKNVPQLIDHFARYRARRGGPWTLVLIGPGRVPLPAGAAGAIVDLGFVPAQDKQDAYAAADLFCQPSLNESFSLVLMEAWSRGTPALVHGGCAVTREHATVSGGGLFYENYADFEGILDRLTAEPALGRRLGEAGRRYARDHYRWDRIIDRWIRDVLP